MAKQPPVRLAETLGTRLRRRASEAERGNPTSNLPWKVPPAYAQGEAIVPGKVRAAGGNWYVALSTATTVGASGPTHANANPAFDGAGSTGVLWDWIGPARMAADDPMAPTVTIEAYGSPSLPNLVRPALYPAAYRMLGAAPLVYDTVRWRPRVFSPGDGQVVYGLGSYVEFMLDGDALAIDNFATALPTIFVVDGRVVTLDGTDVSASTSYWAKISIPGGRGPHRIQIRGDRRGWFFSGVRIAADAQIYAPPVHDTVRMACIEDSIGAGSNYGPYVAGQALHRRLGDLLGIDDVWSFSIGGTGYISKGTDGLPYSFRERLAQVVAVRPDIVTFGGSVNDRGTKVGTPFASTAITSADITAAALATYRELRRLGYAGPIIVFGVIPIDDSAATGAAKIAAVEQAVADAVTAFADPQCWFVPMRNDPAGPWVTGAWNNSAAPGSANSGLITNTAGIDKIHPGDVGIAYYAQRRANALKRSVLPNIR